MGCRSHFPSRRIQLACCRSHISCNLADRAFKLLCYHAQLLFALFIVHQALFFSIVPDFIKLVDLNPCLEQKC